jgi:hypothetical protein
MDYIIENGQDILASETFARLYESQDLMKEVMGKISRDFNVGR